MAINGNNIIVFVSSNNGSSWTAVAGTKIDKIRVDGEMIEVSSATQSDWKDFTAGRKTWSIQTDWLLSAVGDIRKVLMVNTKVKIRMGAKTFAAGTGLEGYAWVKTIDCDAPENGLCKGQFVFQGTGALT